MLEKFFFSSVDNRHYAILRIVFGLLALLTLTEMAPNYTYYGDINNWFSSLNMTFIYKNIFEWKYLDQVILYSLITSAFFVTIGLFTRVSLIYLLIGFKFLTIINQIYFYAADTVVIIMLVYLLFSDSEKIWSFDSFRKKRKLEISSVFSLRLMQIHISIIYILCGITKTLNDSWLIGQAPFEAITVSLYHKYDLDFLINYPLVFYSVRIYGTFIVFWETFFPLFKLNKSLRYISLFIGSTLHIGIIIFMKHLMFGYIMLATYLAFISFDEMKAIYNYIKRKIVLKFP